MKAYRLCIDDLELSIEKFGKTYYLMLSEGNRGVALGKMFPSRIKGWNKILKKLGDRIQKKEL